MAFRFFHRCRSILTGGGSRRDAQASEPAREETTQGADLASEFDELETAFHVDDTFREPRQVEQLQRLLDRYQTRRDNSK